MQAPHEPAGGEGGAQQAGSPVQLAVIGVDVAVAGADGPVPAGAAPGAHAPSRGQALARRPRLALAARAAVLAQARICNITGVCHVTRADVCGRQF